MYQESEGKYKYKERAKLEDLLPNTDDVQKVNCPACAAAVPSKNINIQSHAAKCDSCDSIFSIKEQVASLTAEKHVQEEVKQPAGVTIDHYDDQLDISVEQPWSVLEIVFISFLPLLVMMFSAIVVNNVVPTIMSRILMASFWVASLIGYVSYFFIRKRHKIYIHLDDEHLSIERRPRKLIRDRRYALSEIDQLYIKNVVTVHGTKGIGLFMIVNGVDGQKHEQLIPSLKNRSQAKFIEQEIERKLGIVDRRVPDEDT